MLFISQIYYLLEPIFPFRSPYREPYGNAVKVFISRTNDEVYSIPTEIENRLRLFYWIGE